MTYLVNGIRSESGETPYSMVTAFDQRRNRFYGGRPLAEDEAFITRWLADDRGLAEGDSLTLRYFVAGEGRELRENESTFRVAGILPMDNTEVNRSWTPDFPGVSDTENCRDWDPGFSIDLDAIRDEDEAYWDEYRGTPKVFIGLDAGTRLWRNRFGEWTALRFPRSHISAEDLASALRRSIGVDAFGIEIVDVRGQASAAAAQSMDFGGLFVSMGFFLVLAALVLAALLFLFSIEKRASQIGLLLAVGLTRRRVRRIFLVEALLLSIMGVALGTVLGIAYTKLALWALAGEWSGAVAGARMVYAASPSSLVIGALATVVLALVIASFVTRRIAKAHAGGLLAGGFGATSESGGFRPIGFLRTKRFWIGAILVALSVAGMIAGRKAGAAMLPAVFFGAGSGLLVAGLFWIGAALAVLRGSDRPANNVWALGMRNAVRRGGRSLTVAGVMAAGVFLVVAVNAFRLSADRDSADRRSGTGGFALFAESSLPIYEDLNAAEGRQAFGLEEDDIAEGAVVSLRQSEGDDASCLNLNRAQRPIVWGVDPAGLARRGAFSFAAIQDSVHPASSDISPWTILDATLEDGVIPVVADQNTAMWALGLKLGGEVVLDLEENRTARMRIVGFVSNSILQGRLVASEKNFIRLFPESGGYRAFLIDSPVEASADLRRLLTRQLQNRGLDVVGAPERLAGFNAVQNTYLTIFST
ncbi:MAG TPA: ABC transporter permease, partial [Longimicrobiaceae bacterium]|nr:ABC transporter permease [Longimicrobiaceae bacterium]